MQLTEKPDIVHWPETHYVYVEAVGPFEKAAPQAWQALHRLAPEIGEPNKIKDHMSLYEVWPQKIYRAGVSLASPPVHLPEGLQYMLFQGGKYSRFVLTGPYSDLPEATSRAVQIFGADLTQVRNGFYIEHYVNDPRVTPQQDLITEILIPTA